MIIDTYADVLTQEELDLLLDILLDRVPERLVAALNARDYYVRPLQTEPLFDPAVMSTGVVRMVDAHGLPIADLRVVVETRHLPRSSQQGGLVYYHGHATTRRVFLLNADGEARIPLLRGAEVVVHIENGFARQLTVPDIEEFDIMGFTSDADAYVTPAPPKALPLRGDL